MPEAMGLRRSSDSLLSSPPLSWLQSTQADSLEHFYCNCRSDDNSLHLQKSVYCSKGFHLSQDFALTKVLGSRSAAHITVSEGTRPAPSPSLRGHDRSHSPGPVPFSSAEFPPKHISLSVVPRPPTSKSLDVLRPKANS